MGHENYLVTLHRADRAARQFVLLLSTDMQHKHLQFGHGFRVILGDKTSQAAQMTLEPGENEGGPNNSHHGDQWLFAVRGTRTAIVNGERSTFAKARFSSSNAAKNMKSAMMGAHR